MESITLRSPQGQRMTRLMTRTVVMARSEYNRPRDERRCRLIPGLNSFIIQPESYGATVDEGFIVGGPVGDFELLLCHGTVCVVGKMRDLILQLSKSSIYS
jgi:hypothetical protein